jgi:hypothetical protein
VALERGLLTLRSQTLGIFYSRQGRKGRKAPTPAPTLIGAGRGRDTDALWGEGVEWLNRLTRDGQPYLMKWGWLRLVYVLFRLEKN